MPGNGMNAQLGCKSQLLPDIPGDVGQQVLSTSVDLSFLICRTGSLMILILRTSSSFAK